VIYLDKYEKARMVEAAKKAKKVKKETPKKKPKSKLAE